MLTVESHYFSERCILAVSLHSLASPITPFTGKLKHLEDPTAATLLFRLPISFNGLLLDARTSNIDLSLVGMLPGKYLLTIVLDDSQIAAEKPVDLSMLAPPNESFKCSITIKEETFLPTGVLELKGIVKNTGVSFWDIAHDESESPILIGANLATNPPSSTTRDFRSSLGKGRMAPGETSDFLMRVLVAGCPCDSINLSLDLVRDPMFWSFSPEIPFKKTIEIPHAMRNAVGTAKITVTRVELLSETTFSIHGVILNTGNFNLENPWEGLTPYVVRCLIKTGDMTQELRWCGTSRLNSERLRPNEEVEFSLEAYAAEGTENIIFCQLELSMHYQDALKPLAIVDVTLPQKFSKVSWEAEMISSPYKSDTLQKLNKPSLFWFSPAPPHGDRDTASIRLFEILKILKESGYDVTLLFDVNNSHIDPAPYLEALDNAGIPWSGEPFRTLAALDRQQDYIFIASYYHIAAHYFQPIKKFFPKSKYIVDSVDIEWLRLKRGLESGFLTQSARQVRASFFSELTLYDRADAVWVVSEDDKEELARKLPRVQKDVVGLVYLMKKRYLPKAPTDGVLFVGNFLHEANSDAAHFAHEICKQVRARSNLSFPLFIVGPSAPDSVRRLNDGFTHVLGKIPSMEEIYSKVAVALCPLRFGAGIKGKICESISYGVPVITTTIGNEGLGLTHEKEIFVGDSLDELTELLIKVLHGQYNLESITTDAASKISESCSPKAILTAIRNSFQKLSPLTFKD